MKGNITRIGSGEGPEGYISAAKEALTQYLKSGEDPVVGLITEMITGETYIGEKLKWTPESAWKMVRDRLPMISQDIMDLMHTRYVGKSLGQHMTELSLSREKMAVLDMGW